MSVVKKRNSIKEVLGFTYPRLHTGKTWYVDFFALDPANGQMRRKKYHLDNIPKITERRKRANEIIEGLMKQLRSGWNPWVNTEESRGYTLFEDCLDKYLEYIMRMDRAKTQSSYRSRVNILREYIESLVIPIKYVYQFDSVFVTDFLDWIYLDRDSSPRTVNNYRGWCSALAEFLIERKYLQSNPVEKIKVLKEDVKKRKDLTPAMLKKMSAHLKETDKHFLLACYFEYFTFIRPTELSHLKIGDISLKTQTVFVPKEVSKNKRDANVGLNDTIIKLLLELDTFKYPDSYYLFGKDFIPSDKRANADSYNRRWKKMRNELKWEDCYQFYSLKDSGIRDLANSEGIVIARDQARHTDVATTNKYLQGHDMAVHIETKTFKGVFDEDDVN